MIYEFELQGQMPMLMHADDVEASDLLDDWRKDPANKNRSRAGDDRSPPWTWMSYLYSDGEFVTVPADNIMRALRTAGAMITMKKQKSFKAASQSGLLITTEHCELRIPKHQVAMADLEAFRDEPFAEHARRVQELGFKLYIKRAAVGSAKHVRVRARFEEWSVTGKVEVLDSIISKDVLAQMFDLAGRHAGLLDGRPSSPRSPWPFGRFTSKLGKAA